MKVTVQTLDAQGKLSQSKRSLVAQAPVSQPGDILVGGVVWAIDDPQVAPERAIQSAPRVRPEVRVLVDAGRVAWIRKLEEQRPRPGSGSLTTS